MDVQETSVDEPQYRDVCCGVLCEVPCRDCPYRLDWNSDEDYAVPQTAALVTKNPTVYGT